jgi:hypothetical protein
MNIYLLGIVAIALLVIILLIVYLTSKVNDLERETLSMASRLQAAAQQSTSAQGPFAGLSGQALWDAVCGAPPENIDNTRLNEVRQRYEPVLTKHIQSLFWEGSTDGQMGASGTPENKQRIKAQRGSVESWLPQEACNAIYQCGQDSVTKPAPELELVRIMLDDICASLFTRAGLELRQPFSEQLMAQVSTTDVEGASN